MVLGNSYLCTAFVFATFGAGSVLAQTDLITNGSFESGLTGWTVAPSAGNPAAATVSCSFNSTTAAGTETQTGTAALPPSSGSNLAMGSIRGHGNGSSGGNSSCVLYQDVFVPAGVTVATLNLSWGLKKLGVPNSSAAISARVYNTTTSVPFFSTSGVLNAGTGIVQFPADSVALVSATSGAVTTSALAGRTVRVALFIDMTVPASTTSIQIAAGFDQVQLLANVPVNISAAFGTSSIHIGGSTSLTYTITNPPSTSPAVTGVGFTNALPAGLIVATPNNLTGSCGGGTISATPGSNTISLSGGTLAAGTSCTFSVDVLATSGGTKNNSVTVSSSAGTGTTSSATLTVIPAPTVTSVAPNSGPPAGGNTVTIAGTNFTGATSVTFAGAAATSFTVVNATTITAVVPAGSPGPASVLVTTASGSNAANTAYAYAAPPTVTSVTPASGPTAGGNTVTISGTGFTGPTSVTFAGAAATSFTVVSTTTITAVVPAGSAGPASVVVTTPNGSNAPNSLYTYGNAPTVTSVSPNSGPTAGGNTVTIAGAGFTGATAVTFGSTAATSFSVLNDTTITATVPAASSGVVNVAVTTPSGTSAPSGSSQFTYVALPVISNLSPLSGPLTGGASVTITGTAFTGATAVTFGSTAATSFSVVDDTTITATAPAANAGVVNVAVTTPGGTSASSGSSQFTYIALPVISNLSPASGPVAGGTAVTITGTGFTGATAVVFGSTPVASFTVVSATTITTISPAGSIGAVNVAVTTPAGTSAFGAGTQFVYGNLPVITAVTPSGGPVAGGTTVTITGSNFTGATGVRFGTRAARSFAVLSDTTITAVAPELLPGSVDITVSTANGTSVATAAATYTARQPVPVDVPTLGEWAMIALGLMLAGAGYLAMRNRFA